MFHSVSGCCMLFVVCLVLFRFVRPLQELEEDYEIPQTRILLTEETNNNVRGPRETCEDNEYEPIQSPVCWSQLMQWNINQWFGAQTISNISL